MLNVSPFLFLLFSPLSPPPHIPLPTLSSLSTYSSSDALFLIHTFLSRRSLPYPHIPLLTLSSLSTYSSSDAQFSSPLYLFSCISLPFPSPFLFPLSTHPFCSITPVSLFLSPFLPSSLPSFIRLVCVPLSPSSPFVTTN